MKSATLAPMFLTKCVSFTLAVGDSDFRVDRLVGGVSATLHFCFGFAEFFSLTGRRRKPLFDHRGFEIAKELTDPVGRGEMRRSKKMPRHKHYNGDECELVDKTH